MTVSVNSANISEGNDGSVRRISLNCSGDIVCQDLSLILDFDGLLARLHLESGMIPLFVWEMVVCDQGPVILSNIMLENFSGGTSFTMLMSTASPTSRHTKPLLDHSSKIACRR